MTPTPEVQERMRRYLLGQLDEDAHEEVEKGLLTSDEVFEELLIVEDEIIDEYLAGKLDDGERAAFQNHFLATPERHDKLKFGRAFNRYLSSHAAAATRAQHLSSSAPASRSWTQALFSSPLKIGVLAIIVIAAAFGVWRISFHQSEIDKGLDALNAAYKGQRPLESRISALDYAPYSTTRGPGDEKVDQNELRRAELTLLEELNKHPTPAVHHALGKVFLAKKEFDKAIEQFNEALKGNPQNAQLFSDLGAAWLEKGRVDLEKGKAAPDKPDSGKGLEELGRSLENLNTALNLDSRQLEALFNRALCLQFLAPGQAGKAWEEYLERDAQSQWAVEARRNLKLISGRNIRRETPAESLERFCAASARDDSHQAWEILSRTREMITGRMVPFQLTRKLALRSTKDDESKNLAALVYAGKLEREKSGDYFVSDLGKYYSFTTPAQRDLLTQAHAELDAGYRLCTASAYSEASVRFLNAQLQFLKAGDALEAQITDYWIAYCDSQADRFAVSIDRLQGLALKSRQQKHKWCESQALCLLANCYDLLGEHSRAIAYNQMGLVLAEQLSDTYNQQKLLTQMAIEYTGLGRPQRALAFLNRSLDLADPNIPRQQWRNYTFGSQTFYSLKLYHAAAAFEQAALSLATDELKSSSLAYLSTVHLAIIFTGMQRYDEAQRAAEKSLQMAYSASDDPSAPRMVAYSTIQLGHLRRLAGDCNGALAFYDKATEVSERMEFDLDKYDAHKGKLLCYVQARNDSATEQELNYVLALFETNRQRILEKQNRDSFFDGEQSIYDIGIDYALKQGDLERAFWFSETSRARSLLDSLSRRASVSTVAGETEVVFSSVSTPLNLEAIRAKLPAGLQLVQYNVLKDRVLIWSISKEKYSVVEKPIREEQLNSQISEYVSSITDNEASRDDLVRKRAVELYQLLISPIESEVNSANEICFIPDKALFYLPFASLVSPVTGEYLIARPAILFSPSASVLIACSQMARDNTKASAEALLSVGNPSFDTNIYSGLPALPAAEREATNIAKYYPRKELLIGQSADKNTVIPGLSKANVIHLACHYLPDELSPMKSKLLLAPKASLGGPTDDGALAVEEIVRRKIPQARLVVLSGCRTGLERYFRGEGMVGLSETFIAAGAPLVLASQWSVDSEATAVLMTDFHRHRTEGRMNSVSALQAAQLDMLNSPDDRYRRPYYWAAFLPIGGATTY